jgi:hypothetical protein
VKGWLDKEMTWLAPYDRSLGSPAVFSDTAIQFRLTIVVPFKLPLKKIVLDPSAAERLARVAFRLVQHHPGEADRKAHAVLDVYGADHVEGVSYFLFHGCFPDTVGLDPIIYAFTIVQQFILAKTGRGGCRPEPLP